MAEPTPVNGQITDAVTQANVKVLAEAPAMALGSLYQSLAHSTGLMFENAVNAQQQSNMTAQAATTQGVILLYSLFGHAPPAPPPGPSSAPASDPAPGEPG
jgi:hypothetical protein